MINILKDKFFNKGFSISYLKENNRIDYNGKIACKPIWTINEEGGNDFFDSKTEITNENGFDVIKSPNGTKIVKINKQTGAFYFEVNASKTFLEPRKYGQGWPHILFVQNFHPSKIGFLSQMKELNVCIDFELTKFIDYMGDKAIHDMHACQFQWYCVLKNLNKKSKDYKKWFWFGLQFFDNRYDFCPQDIRYDGGKSTATGQEIYTVDMKKVYNGVKVTLGENKVVNYNILPEAELALIELQKHGFFKETAFDDLKLVHTNIGWEMPGTYDAGVIVNSYSVNYTKK